MSDRDLTDTRIRRETDEASIPMSGVNPLASDVPRRITVNQPNSGADAERRGCTTGGPP